MTDDHEPIHFKPLGALAMICLGNLLHAMGRYAFRHRRARSVEDAWAALEVDQQIDPESDGFRTLRREFRRGWDREERDLADSVPAGHC